MGAGERAEYRVVLIDDEPIILKGLQATMDWERYGCRIIGTARDGHKGLELIRAEQPDIVFTDICMPNMDGLTMIAALKSEFPHMCIAILTGYRDFEYARQALTLGVERFLLKPSKMEELAEAIQFMTAKLSSQSTDRVQKPSAESGEAAGLSPAGGRMQRESTGETAAGAENAGVTAAEGMTTAGAEGSGIPAACAENAGMSPAGGFLVREALKYMEEHCTEHILLSDVSDHIYVSQWHLSKLLNRETGRKYSDILNGYRIEKAKEYLSDPSMTIADIAERTGYTDLANFSRVFRRQTGMSANEYRNRISG